VPKAVVLLVANVVVNAVDVLAAVWVVLEVL
jgi:hypothetical protein